MITQYSLQTFYMHALRTSKNLIINFAPRMTVTLWNFWMSTTALQLRAFSVFFTKYNTNVLRTKVYPWYMASSSNRP